MVKISHFERLAFWEVYKGKCKYCSIPMTRISDMHIDHIFPEDLKNQPEFFNQIKKEFDLPEDFDLNDYYNLICSCATCNRDKSNKLREKSAMLTYYSIAKENKPKIIAVLNKKTNLLKTSKSLTQLKAIMEQGFLKPKEVIELINLAEDIIWQVHNPVIITFILYNEEDKDIPIEYWKWCDQCFDKIINILNENLTCQFSACEESRDGEGYGVRFAFWGLDRRDFYEKVLPKINDWDIPEVLPFENIYDVSAKDLFFKLEQQEKE